MIIRGWGCVNVLDEYFPYVPEHVAVVNKLHMLSYDHQGGGGVLTSLTGTSLTLRNILPLLTIEPLLLVLNKCPSLPVTTLPARNHK